MFILLKSKKLKKHLTRQINRLQSDFLSNNNENNKNIIEKQKPFEPAYEEKKQRIEKALKYSQSRDLKNLY